MKRSTQALTVGSLAVLAAACGGEVNGGGSGGGGGGGGAAQTGLPCDVAEVFAKDCLSCHGDPPTSKAPIALVTYDQLMAPSEADPSQSYLQRSILRMQSAATPMPPKANPADYAADAAILQAWLDAGAPEGSCSPIIDPLNADPICTSGSFWPKDPPNEKPSGDPAMYPGQACISCHAQWDPAEPELAFYFAGTVYPTGHEPDACAGVNGVSLADVSVVIEDAVGAVYTLKPNASGNFYLGPAELGAQPLPTFPYTAKVVSSLGERVMNGEQTDGDCNGCHTQDGGGNGSMAPGRITLPF